MNTLAVTSEPEVVSGGEVVVVVSVMVRVALNLEGGGVVVVVMLVMVVVEAVAQLAFVLCSDAMSCFEALHGRRCQTYDHSVCLLLSSGRFYS